MPFMNITPLRPEHVEPLARALYRQWHDFAPWSSMEKIRTYYAECLNGETLPLAFAAIGNGGALSTRAGVGNVPKNPNLTSKRVQEPAACA